MKRFLMFFVPGKHFWRMLGIMLPAMLFGGWMLPITAITYFNWMVICLLVAIWSDVSEIRDKVGIR